MKCPHCAAKVSLFSKAMNAPDDTKLCPHCGRGVKLGLVNSRFALGFLSVAIVALLLGVSGAISAGIAGAVGAAVGMGLKPATDGNASPPG